MVLIDDLGTSRHECFFSNVVLQDVPEHVNADVGDARTHRNDAEVGGLGDDGRKEGFVKVVGP